MPLSTPPCDFHAADGDFAPAIAPVTPKKRSKRKRTATNYLDASDDDSFAAVVDRIARESTSRVPRSRGFRKGHGAHRYRPPTPEERADAAERKLKRMKRIHDEAFEKLEDENDQLRDIIDALKARVQTLSQALATHR
jgi:hypothetical protein